MHHLLYVFKMESYQSMLEYCRNLIEQLRLPKLNGKEENVEVAEQDALIVVSNRLPFIITKNPLTVDVERKSSAGGLDTAIAPVVAQCKGKWVGWTGVFYGPNEEPDPIPEADINDKTPTAGIKAEQIVPVYCDEKRFKNYYDGCCNGGLWPLFHSIQDRAVFSDDHWQDYVAVNELFAEKTVEAIRNVREANSNVTPLIWIHDSQLMLAASTNRELSKKDDIPIKIGFFFFIFCSHLSTFSVFVLGVKIFYVGCWNLV